MCGESHPGVEAGSGVGLELTGFASQAGGPPVCPSTHDLRPDVEQRDAGGDEAHGGTRAASWGAVLAPQNGRGFRFAAAPQS